MAKYLVYADVLEQRTYFIEADSEAEAEASVRSDFTRLNFWIAGSEIEYITDIQEEEV